MGKYPPNGGAAVKHFLLRVAPTARNSYHFRSAGSPGVLQDRSDYLHPQQKHDERASFGALASRARLRNILLTSRAPPGTALFMKKIIHLNAFSQCAAALQSFGQFRNPRDRTSREYTSTRFWVDLARELEAGCFDSLFFADIHGVYDVYKGGSEAGIQHAVQFPGNDPTLLFPALAQ